MPLQQIFACGMIALISNGNNMTLDQILNRMKEITHLLEHNEIRENKILIDTLVSELRQLANYYGESIMNNPQCEPTKWYQPFFWKVRNKIWWLFLPLMNWIHDKTKHCQEPEYFKAHPKLVRLTGGLCAFSWTWICGHHFGFSFHIGNIYWQIGKNWKEAKGK